jgi:hypothetical protein
LQIDTTVLTWKDWLIVGWALATLWHARSRRSQGERLGTVEKAIVLIAKAAGVELDEESNPGRPRKSRGLRGQP